MPTRGLVLGEPEQSLSGGYPGYSVPKDVMGFGEVLDLLLVPCGVGANLIKASSRGRVRSAGAPWLLTGRHVVGAIRRQGGTRSGHGGANEGDIVKSIRVGRFDMMVPAMAIVCVMIVSTI